MVSDSYKQNPHAADIWENWDIWVLSLIYWDLNFIWPDQYLEEESWVIPV